MIHPQAVVDPGARIGKEVSVGAFSIIGPNVEIGDHTWVGPHVVINGPTRIGPTTKSINLHRLAMHLSISPITESRHNL